MRRFVLALITCLPVLLFALPVLANSRADFDRDKIDDLVVYRPPSGSNPYGYWYVWTSSGACPPPLTAIAPTGQPYAGCVVQWGLAGDVPLIGDFNGDGYTDFVVYRSDPVNPTFWGLYGNNTTGAYFVQQWGQNGDIPAITDVNGDGLSDLAVFRFGAYPGNSNWYVRQYIPGVGVQWLTYTEALPYGVLNGAMTIPGPFSPTWANEQNPVTFTKVFDGESRLHWDIIYPESNTYSYVEYFCGATYPNICFQFQPVVDDLGGTANKLADFVLFEPNVAASGTWYFKNNGTGIPTTTFTWGGGVGYDDVAVAGDYDGDGTSDPTTWRRSGSPGQTWFIKPSSGTCPSYTTPVPGGCSKQWGLPGDIPIGH